jgi:hypothetical protein
MIEFCDRTCSAWWGRDAEMAKRQNCEEKTNTALSMYSALFSIAAVTGLVEMESD